MLHKEMMWRLDWSITGIKSYISDCIIYQRGKHFIIKVTIERREVFIFCINKIRKTELYKNKKKYLKGRLRCFFIVLFY